MIRNLISRIARKYGTPVPTIFEHLKREKASFRICFDVGAFHGQFAEKILELSPAAQVFCFEPSPDAFKKLQVKFSNVPAVHLNNVALSNCSGSAVFNLNAFAETNSLLQSAEANSDIALLTDTKAATTVQLGTIDEFCATNSISQIDFLKIDTQGNSLAVLQGAQQMLSLRQIKYLYVEAEFIEIYKNEKLFGEIVALMHSFGYKVNNLYNLNYSMNTLAWCDILFSAETVI